MAVALIALILAYCVAFDEIRADMTLLTAYYVVQWDADVVVQLPVVVLSSFIVSLGL
jgi:hypothetical protein